MSKRAVQQNTSQFRSEVKAQDISGLYDEGTRFIVTIIPVLAHCNSSGSPTIRTSQRLNAGDKYDASFDPQAGQNLPPAATLSFRFELAAKICFNYLNFSSRA